MLRTRGRGEVGGGIGEGRPRCQTSRDSGLSSLDNSSHPLWTRGEGRGRGHGLSGQHGEGRATDVGGLFPSAHLPLLCPKTWPAPSGTPREHRRQLPPTRSGMGVLENRLPLV